MNNIPLTIEDLMAQNAGRRLYRITITNNLTDGVFWMYDELCDNEAHARRVAASLIEKNHSDSQGSWCGHVSDIQALGRGDAS
jgi:hypothetical protein